MSLNYYSIKVSDNLVNQNQFIFKNSFSLFSVITVMVDRLGDGKDQVNLLRVINHKLIAKLDFRFEKQLLIFY